MVTLHSRPRHETGLLTGLWCLAVVLLWGLAVVGVEALSVSRAYTSVAATWSASQRDAAFHVTQYAASHDAGDYADFLTAVKQPGGARKALAELSSPHPNLAVARAAFLDTGVDERDVDEILRSAAIVRRLGLSETFLARGIALDTELQELRHLASRLHAQITLRDPSRARLGYILSEIHDAKHRIITLESDFARDVSRTAHRAKTVVLTVISVTALAVLGLGGLLVVELAGRIRRSEAARLGAESALRQGAAPGTDLAARRIHEGLLATRRRELSEAGRTAPLRRPDLPADPPGARKPLGHAARPAA